MTIANLVAERVNEKMKKMKGKLNIELNLNVWIKELKLNWNEWMKLNEKVWMSKFWALENHVLVNMLLMNMLPEFSVSMLKEVSKFKVHGPTVSKTLSFKSFNWISEQKHKVVDFLKENFSV